MNTITVQAEHLAAALKHGVASSRSPMAALQHARLRVDGAYLQVETTDCEVWIKASMPVEAGGDFDLLLHDELLRPVAAPGAGELVIRPDGRITTGRGRYTVPAMPADTYPTPDDAEWERVDVDPVALRAAVQGVAYTGEAGPASNDIFRAVHVTPGLVWCTDGKQIGAIALDYDGPTIALPIAQVRRVLDALEPEGAEVHAGNTKGERAGLLRITSPELQVTLRLVDGSGPPALDMRRYVRNVEEGDARVVIQRDELLQALRRFMPFATFAGTVRNGAIPTVRLVRDAEGLSLIDKTGEFNEHLAGADLGQGGDNWSVAFDPKRLVAALSVIGADTVTVLPHARSGINQLITVLAGDAAVDQIAHLLAPIRE